MPNDPAPPRGVHEVDELREWCAAKQRTAENNAANIRLAKDSQTLDEYQVCGYNDRIDFQCTEAARYRQLGAMCEALHAITDHGWHYDGRVSFVVNVDTVDDAKGLNAVLTAALPAN
jgi:hypothetical protein